MSTQRNLLATDVHRGAAVAAASIGGWLALTILVEKLLGFMSIVLSTGASSGLYGLGFGPEYWLDAVSSVVFFALPAVVGFFLAWRFVTPITSSLSLSRVITNSVVGASLAAAVYFVVRLLLGALTWSTWGGSLFANSFPAIGYQGPDLFSSLVSYVLGAILAFLTFLPPGVLAGVLLHRWLQRHDESQRADV